MFYWIYDYPSQYIGALFAAVFVGITCLWILVFRPIVRSWVHGKRSANDIVGIALSGFSVLYGLLLGLLAVAAYQNFSNVSDLVSKEAATILALYRDTQGYPQPIRDRLQAKLLEYARFAIEEGWADQRRGVVPTGGTARVVAFFDDLIAFKPSEKSEEIVHSETLREFNTFVEVRRQRLANVTTGIPTVLWWVVAIGALLNITLIWLLDTDVRVHLLLGGILSLFLGVVIFLIAALDNPFRGDVSVGPDSIQVVYDDMIKKSGVGPQ